MSAPKAPSKAKLVISFISQNEDLTNSCIKKMGEEFSPPDFVSEFTGFFHTSYYEDELGGNLKRRFASFTTLFERDALPAVKIFTNRIENDTAVCGKRAVNIDPGFLTTENFILASGKNFTHRVYLGDGIFADLTLIFSKGDFVGMPWTYPDYKERGIKDMLKKIRAAAFLI